MHPCERVDLGFIDSAPHRFRNSVDLAITPEQLFEVFADAESWPQWAPVITNVTWTSPLPATSAARASSRCGAGSSATKCSSPGNRSPT